MTTEAVDAAKEMLAETSRQLEGAISDAQDDASQKRVAKARYDFATRRKKAGDLDPALDRLSTTILVQDIEKEYAEIEKFLRGVGPTRTNHTVLMKALDKAESWARRAHKLYVTVVQKREEWEHENFVVFSAMRDEANRRLQKEKDDKVRSKQITDSDIDHKTAAIFPDEYGHQEVKRKRIEMIVKDVEHQVSRCNSRCQGLNTMLAKVR
jgi:hypothetical protein